MASLVLFELKKALTRRVAVAVNAGVLLMLVAIMALNVVQTQTTDASGEILSGTDAIAQSRANREEHAGTLTTERIVSDLAAYREAIFERVDPDEVSQMTGSAVYDLMWQSYSAEEVYEFYNPYWSTLLRPWKLTGEEPAQTAARVTPEMAEGWYEAAAQLTQNTLDDGQSGSWEYSEAERAYWTEMQASTEWPLEFGYVEGWSNIIDCAAFLTFSILAVCVTLAPMFANEYQSGTDAVILATRHGRSRLVAAKLVASFVYATAFFALSAAIIVGASLAFFGADGFWLPVQNISLTSPYPLSAGQAALITVGLMYLVCLGFAGLTLAVSSRTKSTLAVFVLDVVLVLLTGVIPSGGLGVLQRVLLLFPMGFTSFSALFAALNSYPLGPLVLDLAGAVVVVYAVLGLVSAPVAVVSFRRHQVA